MFDSVQSILTKYVDTKNVSRFTFYSVEMERGENPEDLYYLCSIKDRYYVIFETDYIMNSLADVAREAADIFKGYDLTPLHWLVKKDAQPSADASTLPIDTPNIDDLHKSLVSDQSASSFSYAVKHAAIEFVRTDGSKSQRFHPVAYSNKTS